MHSPLPRDPPPGECRGCFPPPAKPQVFILKTRGLFRSVVRVPGAGAARPRTDAQRPAVVQSAVGQLRDAARAVSAEDAFLHVRDLATIRIDRDLEGSAAVLTDELRHV